MKKTYRHHLVMYIVTVAVALLLLHLTENVASATTYYVATNGNDANTCAQATSTATPKRNIMNGLACIFAGDTLQIRGGTYDEAVGTPFGTVRGGTSWGDAPKIMAYPGETVTIRPTRTDGYGPFWFSAASARYIIIEGIIADAGAANGFGVWLSDGADHIRFKDGEIKGAEWQGVLTNDDGFHEFINMKIHDNGRYANLAHGLYFNDNSNLVDGCDIYNNAAWGVHIYSEGQSPSNNVIRNNKVHDNRRLLGNNAANILLGTGSGNTAYNNLVYGGGSTEGIHVGFGFPIATGNTVYNNTIYGITGTGIVIDSSSANAVVRNNIVHNNTTDMDNSGTGTTLSHNLFTDPSFVNPAANDFHLRPGSAAIDAGTPLTEEVPFDKDGNARPHGAAYDIGAYEFVC